MGHYVVEGDIALAGIVEQASSFEYPDNLADLVYVSPLIPEGGVVIDAGACIGDQTAIYSQMVGATGHVYAFEPHPASFKALHKNTARLNNVTIYPFGLSDHVDTSPLKLAPNVGACYLECAPGCVDEYAGQFESITVSLQPLDQVLPGLDRCDFIHLDAEGAEPAILRGATTLIERFRPSLMVEVTDRWLKRYGSSEAALIAQLRAWGYQLQSRKAPGDQYDVVASRQILDTLQLVSHTQGASA